MPMKKPPKKNSRILTKFKGLGRRTVQHIRYPLLVRRAATLQKALLATEAEEKNLNAQLESIRRHRQEGASPQSLIRERDALLRRRLKLFEEYTRIMHQLNPDKD